MLPYKVVVSSIQIIRYRNNCIVLFGMYRKWNDLEHEKREKKTLTSVPLNCVCVQCVRATHSHTTRNLWITHTVWATRPSNYQAMRFECVMWHWKLEHRRQQQTNLCIVFVRPNNKSIRKIRRKKQKCSEKNTQTVLIEKKMVRYGGFYIWRVQMCYMDISSHRERGRKSKIISNQVCTKLNNALSGVK